MILRRYVLLLLIFLLAGCAQNIRYHDFSARDKMPRMSYEAYFYIEGSGDKSRAVFLKQPDVNIEIVTSSPQITASTATYAEAISYMDEARGLRMVDTQVVTYKDRPLGYLITYNADRRRTTEITQIVVELYELNGRIYFNAREKLDPSN
jgi:hypothetical protein